jgi:hypothetical protein
MIIPEEDPLLRSGFGIRAVKRIREYERQQMIKGCIAMLAIALILIILGIAIVTQWL